ncbi:hypothetical protein FOA43_001763 [Brettanomyces nanus]|uniref:General negative regulator of transcription subunit n=1 Tax=Eeniella nana TaxID=13502 RepID=A0A875S5F8_EENNA|nr:uncharacterized protein FOA43_001763 [Brettanomyces nanus]QPG74434.1 hypothetical protein FOA43_001763 [Brettanomyces nanus]
MSGEMDRVFKKINEGLEIFDTLYERHQTTSSSSQRDKLESELKKEIKKLQRFREQVKNWQAANEIKEKDKLLLYRQLVEQAMEQYKMVEKGSKSKAFSDDALADSGEPKEENDATRFVRDSLDEIQRQEEIREAELERLSSGKKGRRSSPATDERRKEIETTLSHHHWHTEKLELILRLLENRVLKSDDVMAISDDLQYYLEDNQDPDFIHDDIMYDDLDLDANAAIAHEVHTSFVVPPVISESPVTTPPPTETAGVSEEKSVLKESTPKSKTTSKSGSKSSSPAPRQAIHTAAPVSTDSGRNTPVHSYSIQASSISSVPTLATLKPAPVPKPATDIKWSAAVNAAARVSQRGAKSTPEQTSSAMNLNAQNAASVLEALKKQKPRDGAPVPTSSDSAASSRPTSAATLVPSLADTTAQTSLPTTPQRSETAAKIVVDSSVGTAFNDAASDSSFRFLPPGIQSMILSSAIARDRADSGKTPLMLHMVSMLSIPRGISPLPASTYPPGLEAQRVSTVWNQIRASNNIEMDAQNVDTATLFYAYYFGLSLKEREVATAVLNGREWKCSKDRTTWYQRHSDVKVHGDGFEVADYNLFSALQWNLSEKRNFKLEY